jgi:hypothetical protein
MAFAKVEHLRLTYVRINQANIRFASVDQLLASDGAALGRDIGQPVILPGSHIGSPRDMYRRYQDAMAVIRKFGKPDLFITMTCNPKWEEILDALLPGQTANDRPDIVSRVFHAKLKSLIEEIVDKSLFGKVMAQTHVIEFQKRGLPHVHLLVILSPECKLRTSGQVDAIVSAEIPPVEEARLREIVTKNMIHTPCSACPQAQCRSGGECSKDFPKPTSSQTFSSMAQARPTYRRRGELEGGETFTMPSGLVVNNQWVVPYNWYLLQRFNCHINVEICSGVTACKYLYKYIHKGPDRTMMRLQDPRGEEPIDEIAEYED